ncbi:phage tail protein [Flavobacterium sp. FlaQc-48]|uniref:phage tail protein n=1 Tax=Flavobacterium sp. FlaQc-48 TaxID=3374181 RepID=UPI0037569E12
MEGNLGEIRLFAGNFPPANWAYCDGSSQSIANYDALFVIIGTTYGGDGVSTFNLPDLRGRVPVGVGQGIGLPNVELGQIGGTETTTMTINQMPTHSHIGTGSVAIATVNAPGNTGSPTGNVLAGLTKAYTAIAGDNTLKPATATVTLTNTGNTTPFSIIQPYLSTNYIICMQGIFPTRN